MHLKPVQRELDPVKTASDTAKSFRLSEHIRPKISIFGAFQPEGRTREGERFADKEVIKETKPG